MADTRGASEILSAEALGFWRPIDRTKSGVDFLRDGEKMRKLIMWNLVTLEGFFEGAKPWDLDFHNLVWGEDMNQFSLEQLRNADMLLFGRRTYEGMAAYWKTVEGEDDDVARLMNSLPKAVFSRTLQTADWNNTRLVSGDAEKAVRELKDQPGKDLFVMGSADFSAFLMKAGLFDEYRLGVVPVVLGKGNPLFKAEAGGLKMRLMEARPMKSGALIVSYAPVQGE